MFRTQQLSLGGIRRQYYVTAVHKASIKPIAPSVQCTMIYEGPGAIYRICDLSIGPNTTNHLHFSRSLVKFNKFLLNSIINTYFKKFFRLLFKRTRFCCKLCCNISYRYFTVLFDFHSLQINV